MTKNKFHNAYCRNPVLNSKAERLSVTLFCLEEEFLSAQFKKVFISHFTHFTEQFTSILETYSFFLRSCPICGLNLWIVSVMKMQPCKHMCTGIKRHWRQRQEILGYSDDHKTSRHIIRLTCKYMPDCVGTGPINMQPDGPNLAQDPYPFWMP